MTAETDDPYGEPEERCAWCGEMRAPHEFEDGLRCVYCVEEDQEKDKDDLFPHPAHRLA